ncbi:MAG: M28 family peptidase [Candidatus Aramenus sulfurataquae]|jgi:Iap family predicted aminopeptidase|uniref:M28 family peptidase n=2 Tax=Candidatus Aramenus sulfurataquae TaxID=1326980 RepID=A0AAE3FJG3_9CREN|nr:M28 family peptidase [Candidatus Aramenus sulfurataquae]
MIYERVKDLSRLGEVVAGDPKERRLVSKIEDILTGVDERKVYPIEVLHYESKTFIEGEKEIEAVAFPYSPPIDFSGRISRNVKECKNSGALIELKNLYEVNKYYLEAVSSGCQFVVFTLDDKLRKFVVKSSPLLNLSSSTPPPIPAFYVRRTDSAYIKESLSVKNFPTVRRSTGYVLEAIRNSRGEEKIYVTSHHDHWLAGEHDNLASIAMMEEIKSEKYEMHLISFTAEESGSPNFSSFSWSYGSRRFVEEIKEVENAVLNINLDNVVPSSLVVKASPGVVGLSRKFFAEAKGEVEIYSDGYSFFKKGVPTITVEGVNENYHSDFDLVTQEEEEGFLNVVATLRRMLDEKIEVSVNEISQDLLEATHSLPLALRSRSVNLLNNSILKQLGTRLFKLYGGVMGSSDTYAIVRPFPHFFAINLLRSNPKVYIEGSPAEEIVQSNFYEQYISSKVEEYIKIYNYIIDQILKDFL